MALSSNPLSTGTMVIQVQPPLVHVREGGTVTFHCDVMNNQEPINSYSWHTTPPIPPSRQQFDNNHKTIHISDMTLSENNTEVMCSADGTSLNATGIVAFLKADDDSDNDDDDDDEDEGRPERRTTTKVTRPPNERISPIATTSVTGSTLARRLVTQSHGMSSQDGPGAVHFSPAATATVVSVVGLIIIAILVVIIRRLHQAREALHKTKSNNVGNTDLDRQRSINNGYEAAPTIDSRASQSQNAAAASQNRHYSPRYQKPGKTHYKSLPSLFAVNVDDKDYEHMEPGPSKSACFGDAAGYGHLAPPNLTSIGGDVAYDRLARSNPESIHKLGQPTSSGTPPNYASVTKLSRHDVRSPSYENDNLPSFELCDDPLKVKYASLNHPGGPPSAPPAETSGQPTSYAKILGILRIERTQNSTRVNIDPC